MHQELQRNLKIMIKKETQQALKLQEDGYVSDQLTEHVTTINKYGHDKATLFF